MKWFLDMPTRGKLFISFGLMIILLVTEAITAYISVIAIQVSQRTLYEQEFSDALDIKDIRSQQNAIRANLVTMMLVAGSTEYEVLDNDIRVRSTKNSETLQRLIERNKNSPARLAKLKEFNAIREDYTKTRGSEISLLIYAGKIDEAKKLVLGIQAQRNTKMQAIADELVEVTEYNTRLALDESKQLATVAVRVFAIIGAIAIILGVAMAIFLTQILASPLKRLSDVARRISAGDLTISINGTDRADETGILVQTFSIMVENLRRVMQEMNEGINVLASSASEITAATTQVASGSAETAAAVNQTTTTIEEVKQTSEVSVEKARYVSEIAQKTADISQSGKKSMDESIQAMHHIQEQMDSIAESIVRLSEQSQDISEIIATVNDLAEQSNLLSVNASIEAAKAGEQGKGFAVVAQEVKSMAAQSKQATAQVRTILGDIQKAMSAAVLATEQGSKAVKSGVNRSSEAGESIQLLTENIAESAQAAIQIMSSAQQQLVGMDQVAQAMQNINQASSQNVASTKQAETAAHDLYSLGQKLKLLTDHYKV